MNVTIGKYVQVNLLEEYEQTQCLKIIFLAITVF